MYIRPHVEFATPAWSPWLDKDKQVIEDVQKRFVRMVSGLRSTSYEDKLKELGILSLENRRRYFDLIETYKCIKGISNVKYRTWFTLVGDMVRRETRGSSSPLNIVPNRSRLDIRKHFFSSRVIPDWNNLPNEIKERNSLQSFKNEVKTMLLESGAPTDQGE